MTEILNILFTPLPNAIMTLLTGLSLLYWLFTILLGNGFDFDTDANLDIDGMSIHDIDIDTQIDSDINAETEIQKEPSFLSKTLAFINIGKAPFMVIVTLFKFIGWILTIIFSIVFHLVDYGWKSVFILLPIFILTYFLMHYITIPVVKLYNNLGYSGEEKHEYLTRTAMMKSTIEGDKLGLAEVIIDKDIIRLYVKSIDGTAIQYGDKIVIINEDPNKKYYLVQKEIN